MKLKESIHNELVNLYDSKNTTLEERYNQIFGNTEITEQHIEPLGYFMLNESFKANLNEDNSLNENFFTDIFSNFGGNVTEQLKEWIIGKAMDWFLKPFIGRIGGEDGEMYENIKRYVQVTFADMPFTEIISTVSNCTKMTKLLILGLFEFMLDKMLSSFSFEGVVMDNIRQQLDKTFIEDSSLINKLTDVVDDLICGKTEEIKSRLANMNFA